MNVTVFKQTLSKKYVCFRRSDLKPFYTFKATYPKGTLIKLIVGLAKYQKIGILYWSKTYLNLYILKI